MIKIKFDKASFEKQLRAEVEQKFKKKTKKLVEDLKEATPVDTGLARNSWSIEFDGHTSAKVSNSQEYIDYLNKGSSEQAPRYFIERTLMSNGFKVTELIQTKK